MELILINSIKFSYESIPFLMFWWIVAHFFVLNNLKNQWVWYQSDEYWIFWNIARMNSFDKKCWNWRGIPSVMSSIDSNWTLYMVIWYTCPLSPVVWMTSIIIKGNRVKCQKRCNKIIPIKIQINWNSQRFQDFSILYFISVERKINWCHFSFHSNKML